MEADVVLAKAASIERCLLRVHEEYQGCAEYLENQTKQDAIILNIQRACEVAIDLAAYIVKKRGLGLPQGRRDCFKLLSENQVIPIDLSHRLQKMVGFRNIAVHEYQQIDVVIIQRIIDNHLIDFTAFVQACIALCE